MRRYLHFVVGLAIKKDHKAYSMLLKSKLCCVDILNVNWLWFRWYNYLSLSKSAKAWSCSLRDWWIWLWLQFKPILQISEHVNSSVGKVLTYTLDTACLFLAGGYLRMWENILHSCAEKRKLVRLAIISADRHHKSVDTVE